MIESRVKDNNELLRVLLFNLEAKDILIINNSFSYVNLNYCYDLCLPQINSLLFP